MSFGRTYNPLTKGTHRLASARQRRAEDRRVQQASINREREAVKAAQIQSLNLPDVTTQTVKGKSFLKVGNKLIVPGSITWHETRGSFTATVYDPNLDVVKSRFKNPKSFEYHKASMLAQMGGVGVATHVNINTKTAQAISYKTGRKIQQLENPNLQIKVSDPQRDTKVDRSPTTIRGDSTYRIRSPKELENYRLQQAAAKVGRSNKQIQKQAQDLIDRKVAVEKVLARQSTAQTKKSDVIRAGATQAKRNSVRRMAIKAQTEMDSGKELTAARRKTLQRRIDAMPISERIKADQVKAVINRQKQSQSQSLFKNLKSSSKSKLATTIINFAKFNDRLQQRITTDGFNEIKKATSKIGGIVYKTATGKNWEQAKDKYFKDRKDFIELKENSYNRQIKKHIDKKYSNNYKTKVTKLKSDADAVLLSYSKQKGVTQEDMDKKTKSVNVKLEKDNAALYAVMLTQIKNDTFIKNTNKKYQTEINDDIIKQGYKSEKLGFVASILSNVKLFGIGDKYKRMLKRLDKTAALKFSEQAKNQAKYKTEMVKLDKDYKELSMLVGKAQTMAKTSKQHKQLNALQKINVQLTLFKTTIQKLKKADKDLDAFHHGSLASAARKPGKAVVTAGIVGVTTAVSPLLGGAVSATAMTWLNITGAVLLTAYSGYQITRLVTADTAVQRADVGGDILAEGAGFAGGIVGGKVVGKGLLAIKQFKTPQTIKVYQTTSKNLRQTTRALPSQAQAKVKRYINDWGQSAKVKVTPRTYKHQSSKEFNFNMQRGTIKSGKQTVRFVQYFKGKKSIMTITTAKHNIVVKQSPGNKLELTYYPKGKGKSYVRIMKKPKGGIDIKQIIKPNPQEQVQTFITKSGSGYKVIVQKGSQHIKTTRITTKKYKLLEKTLTEKEIKLIQDSTTKVLLHKETAARLTADIYTKGELKRIGKIFENKPEISRMLKDDILTNIRQTSQTLTSTSKTIPFSRDVKGRTIITSSKGKLKVKQITQDFASTLRTINQKGSKLFVDVGGSKIRFVTKNSKILSKQSFMESVYDARTGKLISHKILQKPPQLTRFQEIITTNDIVTKIDISKGSFYNIFKKTFKSNSYKVSMTFKKMLNSKRGTQYMTGLSEDVLSQPSTMISLQPQSTILQQPVTQLNIKTPSVMQPKTSLLQQPLLIKPDTILKLIHIPKNLTAVAGGLVVARNVSETFFTPKYKATDLVTNSLVMSQAAVQSIQLSKSITLSQAPAVAHATPQPATQTIGQAVPATSIPATRLVTPFIGIPILPTWIPLGSSGVPSGFSMSAGGKHFAPYQESYIYLADFSSRLFGKVVSGEKAQALLRPGRVFTTLEDRPIIKAVS